MSALDLDAIERVMAESPCVGWIQPSDARALIAEVRRLRAEAINADARRIIAEAALDKATRPAPAPSATGEERPRRLALPKGSESISIYPDGRVEVDVGWGLVFSESAANAVGIQERIDAAPAAPKDGDTVDHWTPADDLSFQSVTGGRPVALFCEGEVYRLDPAPTPWIIDGPRASKYGPFPEASR